MNCNILIYTCAFVPLFGQFICKTLIWLLLFFFLQISGLSGENIYTEVNNVNHHPNNNLNHKKEIPVQVDSEFTEVGSPEVRTLSHVHVNGSIPNHHQNEVEDGNSEPPEQTEHIDHHKTNGRATLDITEMQPIESKNHIKLHLTDPIEHTTDTVT